MSDQQVLPGFDELAEPAAAEGISPEEAARISARAQAALEGASSAEEGAVPAMMMADYYQLRAEGWPWRVAVYIAWASMPREIRVPGTLGELADLMGLTSPRAIHSWRSKNPEIDDRVQKLVVEPLMEARADIIQALVDSATNPDHKNHPDRKLALEMTKLHTPRTELDMEITRAGIFLPEVDEAALGEPSALEEPGALDEADG